MAKNMKVLDVGCGVRPRGDVNIDLFPQATEHRQPGTVIKKRVTKNLVVADAHHLPFRAKSFPVVRSRHVLEHLEDPRLFLKECIRVAQSRVELIVPHRYSRQVGPGHRHRHWFNLKWFENALKNYQHELTLTWRFFPHKVLPLIRWVEDIHVTIYL